MQIYNILVKSCSVKRWLNPFLHIYSLKNKAVGKHCVKMWQGQFSYDLAVELIYLPVCGSMVISRQFNHMTLFFTQSLAFVEETLCVLILEKRILEKKSFLRCKFAMNLDFHLFHCF